MEITVNTVTGQNITLKFENPELVKHVDIRVKTEMLILVEAGGEKLELKVERTQTVCSLKQLIVQMKKNKNFICGNNSLQYLGKMLEDSKTLADYDIKEGSTLQAIATIQPGNTYMQPWTQQQQQMQLLQQQMRLQQQLVQPKLQQAQAFASMTASPVSALSQNQQRLQQESLAASAWLPQQQQLQQAPAFASMNANPASALLPQQQQLQQAPAFASMNDKTASAASSVHANIAKIIN